MKGPIMNQERMAKDGHHDVANLDLSGEKVRVGWYVHGDNSVYIQIENASEPTYMSILEAEMLISAFRVAIDPKNGGAR